MGVQEADRLAVAGARLHALLAAEDDSFWASTSDAENWPVKTVAYHVAANLERHAQTLIKGRRGDTLPPVTWEQIEADNRRTVMEAATATREQVVRLLESGLERAGAALRVMSDEDFGRPLAHPVGGSVWTLAEVVRFLIVGHCEEHLANLEAVASRR